MKVHFIHFRQKFTHLWYRNMRLQKCYNPTTHVARRHSGSVDGDGGSVSDWQSAVDECLLATSVVFDVKDAMYILRFTAFSRLMSTTKLDSTPALKLCLLLWFKQCHYLPTLMYPGPSFFRSCIFRSLIFFGPPFSGPANSVPLLYNFDSLLKTYWGPLCPSTNYCYIMYVSDGILQYVNITHIWTAIERATVWYITPRFRSCFSSKRFQNCYISLGL